MQRSRVVTYVGGPVSSGSAHFPFSAPLPNDLVGPLTRWSQNGQH